MEIHEEIENEPALCFDSGLDGRAFAQAGLSRLIWREGVIVKSSGAMERWKIEGTAEKEGHIIFWGKDFAGKPMDLILEGEANEAFNAVRFWIQAQILLKKAVSIVKNAISLAPCGVLCSNESLLFLPEQLTDRCISAHGKTVEKILRYVHPDLEGQDAAVWTLACMLYRVFCKKDAFVADNADILRKDIRESVFLPPCFACPGIDRRLADILQRALSCSKENFPSLEDFSFLNIGDDAEESAEPPAFLPIDNFVSPLSNEEMEKLALESAKFSKKKARTTKVRRFIRKNRSAIFGAAAALVVGLTVVISLIQDQANQPNTKGMTPIEVVKNYYSAMDRLDHLVMTGCVLKNVGKEDIGMTSELYVLSKVRQAYIMGPQVAPIISPETWLKGGIDPASVIVFGVSNLHIQPLDAYEEDGEVSFKVVYRMWAPAFSASASEQEEEDVRFFPAEQARKDELRLTLYKKAWRIAEIKRTSDR